MAGKREIEIGQLRLVDGTRQENPANLAIVERRSFLPLSGRERGQLCVLIELSGGRLGRDQLERELVSAIVEEYYSSRGTETYGLRQAVLLANTMLVRQNAQVSSEHRLGGVACVVLRDGELFIAQAGWPMVYLIQRGQITPFPDTPLEGEDASMLGQHQAIAVQLFHAAIQSGDMILIADGPMARQLGITRIGQIVVNSVERSMRNLEVLAPPEDCTAIVIRIGGEPTGTAARFEKWAYVETESEEQPLSTPPSQPRPFASTSPAKEPVRPPMPVQVDAEAEFDQTELETEEPTPFTSSPSPSRSTQTAQAGDRGWWRQHILPALAKIGQGARTLGERILPDQQPGSEAQHARRRSAARRRHRRAAQPQLQAWIAAAIAIPILILLLVFGFSWYRQWSQNAQFNARLEALKSKRDIALSQGESPMIARDTWKEVLALAADAEAIHAGDAQVAQIRAQAESELDRIDGIRRLGQAFKLYEYTESAISSGRVIVAGLDVYVLDRGAGIVYHHALNDTRNALRNPTAQQMLLRRGQPIEGYNVGPLIDMVWIKDGGERQAGALAILDANGLLLEYDPTWDRFSVQKMGGMTNWRNPVALNAYDSNLYLLDSQAGQVFKYWKQQYGNEPTRWLTQEGTDLSKAIDMGIDGHIYVLHNDGRLTKYFGGEVVSFAVTRMPLPLAHADALYMDVEEVVQYLYIVDSAEGRVVQLSREGAFVRQFKPARGQEAVFNRLVGIFVDETGGKLYYLTSNALYVAELPTLP